jgi:hypothetical protein
MRRLALTVAIIFIAAVTALARTLPADTPGLPPAATWTALPTYTVTHTASATPTRTATGTATATYSPTATPSATPTPTATHTPTATLTPSRTPTAAPVAVAAALPAASGARSERLVLASYFAWYDGDGWDACNISAGDRPLQPYHSDDAATLSRHVRMALDAGIGGFTQHWFAPGERTDANFAGLLAQSQGTSFRSTVVFSRHIWAGAPSPTQGNVAQALRYVLDRYANHANFLRIGGKPVIFFTDMPRIPTAPGQTPQQAWAAVRAAADPGGQSIWIAEGLDASYLAVFDGIYVLKITHAAYPDDYVKATRWASQVRAWEQQTGKPKLWLGTVTPGWDDLRSGCRPDIRVPSAPHQRARDNGDFYRATFDAALQSGADILYVYSFNEWVEGTYIEPGRLYGDLYMRLTRELAQRFTKQ